MGSSTDVAALHNEYTPQKTTRLKPRPVLYIALLCVVAAALLFMWKEYRDPYYWVVVPTERVSGGRCSLYSVDFRGCSAFAVWRGSQKVLAHCASGEPSGVGGVGIYNALEKARGFEPEPKFACIDAGRSIALEVLNERCAGADIEVLLRNTYDSGQADTHERDILLQDGCFWVRHNIKAGSFPTRGIELRFDVGISTESLNATVLIIANTNQAQVFTSVPDRIDELEGAFAVVDAVNEVDFSKVKSLLEKAGVPIAWMRRRWEQESFQGASRIIYYHTSTDRYTVRYGF